MRAWLRAWFLRVFCTHPVVLAPAKAHHAMNAQNIYKIRCVTCKTELRRHGYEISKMSEKECLCVMEKK